MFEQLTSISIKRFTRLFTILFVNETAITNYQDDSQGQELSQSFENL